MKTIDVDVEAYRYKHLILLKLLEIINNNVNLKDAVKDPKTAEKITRLTDTYNRLSEEEGEIIEGVPILKLNIL